MQMYTMASYCLFIEIVVRLRVPNPALENMDIDGRMRWSSVLSVEFSS